MCGLFYLTIFKGWLKYFLERLFLKARNALIIILPLVLGGVCLWSWQGVPLISTGQMIPAYTYPYQQLTYNKLSPDHRGNFTGDVYLLDMVIGETVQLTKGGTTGNAQWLSREEMLVAYRPKGSVVDPYYLDVASGRLSVADKRVAHLLFYQERYEAGFSPNRTFNIVHIPNTDGSQADQYAILKYGDNSAEVIKTVLSASFTLPDWSQNSEMVVYGRFDQQICLLNLESLDEVCRPGLGPVIAPSGQPALVAFLERDSLGYHVCTAEIDKLTFNNVQCHDVNRQQITNLVWRP